MGGDLSSIQAAMEKKHETIQMPRWDMAWEFLRRNSDYISWYSAIQQAAKQVLCDCFLQLSPAKQTELHAAIDEAPFLTEQFVMPVLKRLGLPSDDLQTCFKLEQALFSRIYASVQKRYWLTRPVNPKCSSVPWLTSGILFISPPTLPPPVVQMALDPYLEKPDTITVEINLHAPDKKIWPQIQNILKIVRSHRGYVPKRERRDDGDLRELLRIYDEVQMRLRAGKPKFPGSGSVSEVRVAHAKYQAIEYLVQGGYKRFVFGYSDLKS